MEICGNCFRENSGEMLCQYCGFDHMEQRKRYPLALSPGRILSGRYIVGRVLGQGGFGITYKAWDDRDSIPIAIKEFFPAENVGRNTDGCSVYVHSGKWQEAFEFGKSQFLAEAKTLAEFKGNEAIVDIYSYFEENNTAYFAMEYVDGESLHAYVRRQGGRIPMEKACELLLPVMEALKTVHAKGLVHRDIAPDNILIDKSGQAKLIDFGAARYSTGEKSKTLDRVLKEGFAPKEQYLTKGRQGPFTDVYAMAATYYRVITGRMPPQSISRMDVDELVAPSACGIKMPGNSEHVLLKALAVAAQDRYQTMGQFHDALKAELEQTKKAPKGFRKKSILAVIAVAAALSVLAFFMIPKEDEAVAEIRNPAVTASVEPTVTASPEPADTPDNEDRWEDLTEGLYFSTYRDGDTLYAEGDRLEISVRDPYMHQSEVSITIGGLDLQEKYMTNLKSSQKNSQEYSWNIELPGDGGFTYSAGTSSWAFNPGEETEKTLQQMQHSEFIRFSGSDIFKRVGDVEMSNTADSITWTFSMDAAYSSCILTEETEPVIVKIFDASQNLSIVRRYERMNDSASVDIIESEESVIGVLASGEAESDMAWTLDNEGLLVLEGSGDMTNYNADTRIAPWLEYSEQIEKIKMSDGITSVGEYAFHGCSNLTEIEFSENITRIGVMAFGNCTNLSDVTVPEGVVDIGGSAFYECSALKNVFLPETVQKIRGYAFFRCSSLENFTIPGSVVEIEPYAFYGCNKLESIFFNGTYAQWLRVTVHDGNHPILNNKIGTKQN